MNYIKIISFILVTFFLILCQKEKSQQIFPQHFTIPGSEKLLIARSNDIGFDNFRALSLIQNSTDNLLISPLGISVALNSLIQASNSNTRQEIQKYLQVSYIQDSAVKIGYDHLHTIFSEIDKNTRLDDVYNYIFSEDITPGSNFEEFINKRNYIKISNQGDGGFNPDRINNLLNAGGNGFQLINNVNFSGRSTFQKSVEKLPFYYNPYRSDFVEMVVSEALFNYYGDATLKAVEIPLGRGNFNMLLIVPQGSQSIDDLVKNFNMKLINRIRTKYRPQNLEVFIPTMNVSSITSFSDVFKKGKLSTCFQPKSADFSELCNSNNFILTDFEQIVDFSISFKSNSELDAANNYSDNAPNDKSSFFIDHPYLFVIYEKYADGVLFIGKIMNP